MSPVYPPPEPCPDCGGKKARTAKRCAYCAKDGTTPEQRSKHALCGAKKKNGETCRAFAGQATDHFGIGLCKYHGGSTPNHKKHAVIVEAKQRMVSYGEPIEGITAPEALMGLLRASAGHVSWLQSEVAALDNLASHEAAVLVSLYDGERDRLARVSEACVRAGVAAHIVQMEQARAEMTLTAIRDAAKDAGLNATQLKALGVALRKRLAEHGDDPERAQREAEHAEQRLTDLRAQMSADDERRISRAAEQRARQLAGVSDLFPHDELVPVAERPSDPTPAA